MAYLFALNVTPRELGDLHMHVLRRRQNLEQHDNMMKTAFVTDACLASYL